MPLPLNFFFAIAEHKTDWTRRLIRGPWLSGPSSKSGRITQSPASRLERLIGKFDHHHNHHHQQHHQHRHHHQLHQRHSFGFLASRMETSPIPVLTVQTTPFEDQRPGTNGLRRKTAVFEGKKNYLQNYIQSVLSSMDLRDRQGCTLVVGSDGRYFSRVATEVIVQMAAANGVRSEF